MEFVDSFGVLVPIAIFLMGIIAGWVGSQVGGGAIITVPVLIFLGLSPHQAIATQRFAGYFGGYSSLVKYIRAGKVKWSLVLPLAIISIIGSAIGATLMIQLPREYLEQIVALMMILSLIPLFLSKMGLRERSLEKRSKTVWMLSFAAYLILAIFTGLFAPGANFIKLYLIVSILGLSFTQAQATKRCAGIFGGTISVSIFLYEGLIQWAYALPLMLGFLIGAYMGADYAISKGERWVRGLLAIVVGISSVKLFFF